MSLIGGDIAIYHPETASYSQFGLKMPFSLPELAIII